MYPSQADPYIGMVIRDPNDEIRELIRIALRAGRTILIRGAK